MKLTVLIDNATLIDRYYLGEPGVAYYLESVGCTCSIRLQSNCRGHWSSCVP